MNPIEWVDIGKIKPNPENPNKHDDEQIERLVKLIKYQGWRHPLIVSERTGLLVAGHGRLEAAKRMGIKQVPVHYQAFEDDEQEYAFLVSDNAIASWAELDLRAINSKIPDIGPFDIDLLGIKDFVVDVGEFPHGQGADEDEVPEVNQSEARTKFGELYQLGEHRLLCGDSTDPASVARLMNGEKADMVFTDPPYGMNLNTEYANTLGPGKSFDRKIKNYRAVQGDNEEFNFTQVFEIVDSIKEQFWWGADYYCDKLPKEGSWIVWDKKTNENLQKMYGSDFELCWSRQKHAREIARVTWAGVLGHNKRDDGASKTHPTMKAVKLIEWFFERFEGKLILDLFLGSGSTLIACEKTNRRCYGMEIDPHYCDVIIQRWEKFTGKKATKS